MRVLMQRVSKASVHIDGARYSNIGHGLVLLVGVEEHDDETDIDWIVKKTSQLRIFADEVGKMNKSILDISGEVLVISQFTLHAKVKKGTRPSFIAAADPDTAIPIYEKLVGGLANIVEVKTGIFGADMKVELINDGPVTIWIDSKRRE